MQVENKEGMLKHVTEIKESIERIPVATPTEQLLMSTISVLMLQITLLLALLEKE